MKGITRRDAMTGSLAGATAIIVGGLARGADGPGDPSKIDVKAEAASMLKRPKFPSGIQAGAVAREFKIGEKSDEVTSLQLELEGLGVLQLARPGSAKRLRTANSFLFGTPGEFDNATQAGLKSLQRSLKLNPSGQLDGATIEALSAPRCGSPDLVIKAVGNPWGKDTLVYDFLNIDTSPDINTREKACAVFAEGFGMWSKVCKIKFRCAAGGEPADILIQWGTPACAPYRHEACTSGPPYGDMTYANFITWDHDLMVAFAGHEVGHALGFGHSNDRNCLMYFSIAPKKQLCDEDIRLAQSVYGKV